jgi:hypothetical protein
MLGWATWLLAGRACCSRPDLAVAMLQLPRNPNAVDTALKVRLLSLKSCALQTANWTCQLVGPCLPLPPCGLDTGMVAGGDR